MPDETAGTTPGQQADPAPAQQADPAPASTPPAPRAEDYKPRYDGAVRKIEELTTSRRDLEAQLTAKTSELEQLRSQLATSQVEKEVAVGERDKNLQTVVQEKAALEAEIAKAKSDLLKVQVAREMGHPELIQIMDTIPSMTDPEALKTVMGDLLRFRNDGVKQREQELLAGTSPAQPPTAPVKETPSTVEGWQAHINSLPLGSPERAKALDAWGDWTMKQPPQ